MQIDVRACALDEIAALREKYLQEMNCQVIHDAIHERPGWTREYAIYLDGGKAFGYGSVAIAGPWTAKPALYEFFVESERRMHIIDVFTRLLRICTPKIIETQSNDHLLTTMLHIFGVNVSTESILFEDAFETSLAPPGAQFRAAVKTDRSTLLELELDDGAEWVATLDHNVVGAGGVLYHYNRPYGDVYMKIGAPFRRLGLGAFLVQELKAVCRREGSVPSARCNVTNLASRRTLQRAGFVPCGALITAEAV